MVVLFLVSRSRSTLFGLPLLYHGFFTPLASNLHHTAMFLLPLSFATIFVAEQQKKQIARLLYYIMGTLLMYLATQTGSTKANMGIYLGVAISILYLLTTHRGNISYKTITMFSIVCIISVIYAVLNYRQIIRFAVDYFVENDLNGGRQSIWSSGINIWKNSPLFGWGFGSQVPDEIIDNKYWDAHNTFLTAMLQGGVIGLVIFSWIWIRIINDSFINGYLLAMNMSVFVYVSGGDVLRRIPNWFFVIISFYIIKGLREEMDPGISENNTNYTVQYRYNTFGE